VTSVVVAGVIVPEGGLAAKLNMARPPPSAQRIKANKTRTLENADSGDVFFFIVGVVVVSAEAGGMVWEFKN
jgi:hypothetical protein